MAEHEFEDLSTEELFEAFDKLMEECNEVLEASESIEEKTHEKPKVVKRALPKQTKESRSYAIEQQESPELLSPDIDAWQYCGNFIPETNNCVLQKDTAYFCGRETQNCCCHCEECEECSFWINSCEYLTYRTKRVK